MPHVVIEGAIDLREVWERFAPLRLRRGDLVMKVDRAYLDSEDTRILLEALVASAGYRQRFFLQVTRKGANAVTVRLEPLTDPEKTDGVKRTVAEVALWVLSLREGLVLGPTNIAPLLDAPGPSAGEETSSRIIEASERPADETPSHSAAGATEVELSPYLLPRGELGETLDWRRLFGDERPVELEIGCGKGAFLEERACRLPERGLLGVDWGLPWLRRTAERLRKAGIDNVRLMRSDAKHVLQELVPEASVELLHVYFPDPWPKKRHHKRRLFDGPTTAAMQRILAPGGQLHVATDHGDYWEVITEMLARHTSLVRLDDEPAIGGRTSNFGAKYEDQGREIHQAVWEKRS